MWVVLLTSTLVHAAFSFRFELSRVSQSSVKLLLSFVSTTILGSVSHRDLWPRFLLSPRHLHVQKWSLLFDKGRSQFFYVGAIFVALLATFSGKFLLVLASTVNLGSKSWRTHDHISLPHNSGSGETSGVRRVSKCSCTYGDLCHQTHVVEARIYAWSMDSG
jgi:hypothetical protein